jgi:hypothetical protein
MHLYRIATFTFLAATSLASAVARTSLAEKKTLNVSTPHILVCATL